jgi:hypothetical protein
MEVRINFTRIELLWCLLVKPLPIKCDLESSQCFVQVFVELSVPLTCTLRIDWSRKCFNKVQVIDIGVY